jgi:putative transposon-encoded protein
MEHFKNRIKILTNTAMEINSLIENGYKVKQIDIHFEKRLDSFHDPATVKVPLRMAYMGQEILKKITSGMKNEYEMLRSKLK